MRFFIKKLGCPKNDVDGDFLAGRLISAGHQVVHEDSQAEVVIINTCGFILPAREESIGEILHYEKKKNEGKIEQLYVTGCLAEKYYNDLKRELPNIDGIFGLDQAENIAMAIAGQKTGGKQDGLRTGGNGGFPEPESRFINCDLPYEYLKISDGCDRFCSYCAIPLIRGRYLSRPLPDIIREAEILADAGKREIILVSQEGTGYGRGSEDGVGIIRLLSELEKVEGIKWIKLMYLHPEGITDRLIEHIAFSPKALGYFDIPLQHINDDILTRMNRHISRLEIEKVLRKIRDISTNNIIRTTFIAGFPGETEDQFQELYDFIADFQFDRLGVFKYSREEGTTAGQFDSQIVEEEKERRMEELMLLQQDIAFKKNIDLIDTIQEVIIDGVGSDNIAEGRTRGDCPEIDQTVFVRGGDLKTGDFADVKIIMAEGYDLIASPVKAKP